MGRRAGVTMSLLLFTLFSSALAVPAPCPVLPPMDCGDGMVNCPGPADPMGCSMPDLCIAIGVDCPMGGGNSSTQCPSLPPMDCGEGFTNCPGPLDPMGCAMPDTCEVEGDQCGEGGLPTVPPGPVESSTRVIFRLFPGSGAPLENLDFDGVNVGLGSGSQLNPTKSLKVVIHGWGMSALNNDQVEPVDDMALKFANSYEDAGIDVTVIGVHWVPVNGWQQNTGHSEDTGNAGNMVALLLVALDRDYGISTSTTQVIGFSMGTVVTSKAAKRTQELGLPTLARLTLLDPCPADEAMVISKTDGEYVEAMHTSSQDICSTEPLAHVDFYPNGGLSQVCGMGSCSCFSGATVCDSCYHGKPRCTGLWAWGDNHMRAVELYRESIEASQGRGTTFLSWKCSFSYQEMIANSESCPYDASSQLVPMGEDVLTNGRPEDGIYFLGTNGEEPRSYDSYNDQWAEI